MRNVLSVFVLTALTLGVVWAREQAPAQAPAAPPRGSSGPPEHAKVAPINHLPNPYETVRNWGTLPDGRRWGSVSAVHVDIDGKHLWAGDRCGANSCAGSNVDPMVKLDPNGKVVQSFGAGVILWPHGMDVDQQGNVWVVDARSATAAELKQFPDAKGKGHTVVKFSPQGKVLLTLGKAGGNVPGQPADPASFYQPNDVITYPNGDILVAEGHGNAPPATARLIRFDRTGKFLREYGKMGTALEGEFMQPHGLAFDSKGRLFVADRSNNRIQILDAETYKTLDTWYQFSRLSGIYIDRNDVLYGADSESGSVSPPHYTWKRGIRIGSARDGKVTAFIPDPSHQGLTYEMVDGKVVAKMADGGKPPGGTLAAEGVVVDRDGVIYGAEVGPRKLQRYVKK